MPQIDADAGIGEIVQVVGRAAAFDLAPDGFGVSIVKVVVP